MNTSLGATGGVVACVLSALLVAVPLAFGGVHLWAGASLQIVVWILAAAWFAERRLRGAARVDPVPRGFVVSAAALLAFLALQLVPLPPALVSAVSPSTGEVYARTRAVLETIAVPELPIRPVRWADEKVASVETRERIRALAAEARESTPERDTISLDAYRSKFELFRYAAYGLVIWLAATLPWPHRLQGAIAVAGVSMALLAIVQMATWNGHVLWFFVPYDWSAPRPAFNRMLGSFLNADHLAAFLALSFGPTLALLAAPPSPVPARRRRRRREARFDPVRLAVVGIGVTILVAGLFGSGSRAGIVGTMLSGILVVMGRSRVRAPVGGWRIVRGRERKNRIARVRRILDRALPIAFAAVVVVAGVVYVGPGGREMLDRRLAWTVYEADRETRPEMWRQTLPMIADYALVGTGLGGWSEAVQPYQSYPNVWYRQNHNHNDYLEWIVEVGLVGTALTAILVLAYVSWARRNREIPTLVRFGLLGSVAAVAWHEAFDFVLRVPANAVLLSVILGLLCNRRWEAGEGSAVDEEPPPRTHPRRLVAVAVAGVLALFFSAKSAVWILDFLDEQRVRRGDAAVTRATTSPRTWEALEGLLSRSGFRHHPPTTECLLTAIRLRPASEDSIYRLSQTLPRIADRRLALEAAVRLDPTRSEWRLELAGMLERQGRLDAALAEVEESVRLDPVLARHRYAIEPERTVAPEVILAVESGFRKALAEHGEVPAILADLAELLHREERFAEAAELWLRAAEADGDWRRYGARAGAALVRGGDAERAEQVLLDVIAADPENPAAYRILALEVYDASGRADEAERILGIGARRSRRRAELFLALYALHEKHSRRADALEALARAAEAEPTNAVIQYRLGSGYLGAGDDHRARSALARAVRLEPDRAPAQFALGIAQERLHELGEARIAFERAVELDPSNAGYRAALDRVRAAFAGSEAAPSR